MRLAGIITEYDPFHAGHAWQLRRARELGVEAIAVCMSEDLTQRGAAALLPVAVRSVSFSSTMPPLQIKPSVVVIVQFSSVTLPAETKPRYTGPSSMVPPLMVTVQSF